MGRKHEPEAHGSPKRTRGNVHHRIFLVSGVRGFIRTSLKPTRKPMKIWIDADAAPGEAKEVVYRAARRLNLETVLVANGPLSIPPAAAHIVSAIQVAAGADVADRYIAAQSQPGDVAVTADIPLASLLVEKGVAVIDPRGDEYTAENIKGRLATRNFMDSVRGAGLQTSGAPPYDARDKKAFAGALDRALTRALKPPREKGDGGNYGRG